MASKTKTQHVARDNQATDAPKTLKERLHAGAIALLDLAFAPSPNKKSEREQRDREINNRVRAMKAGHEVRSDNVRELNAALSTARLIKEVGGSVSVTEIETKLLPAVATA